MRIASKDEINNLPDHIRKYIHDLEAICDPAGDVQRMASLEEQVKGLEKQNHLLKEQADRYKPPIGESFKHKLGI